MEFVDGIPVDNLKAIKEAGMNPIDVGHLLNDCFCKQIFEKGIVHGDPHSGNIFASKDAKGKTQLILLDHGLYKYLPEDIRISYAYLWKGLVNKDEDLIRQGVVGLGVKKELYRLFAGMITAKSWDDIMDDSHKTIKERLGLNLDQRLKSELQVKTQLWMREINQCLGDIHPDMLVIMKVNDYLRTLNNRLGQPTDTFYYVVNYLICKILVKARQ